MAKLSKDTVAYQNKLQYIRNYNKEHYYKFYMVCNPATDADILARLNSVGPKATYIKRLIREDIAKEEEGR